MGTPKRKRNVHQISARDRFFAWAASWIMWTAMQLLFLTCRKEVFGREVWNGIRRDHGGRALGCGWHRGLFIIIHHFRNIQAAIMSSRSRDGQLVTELLHRFGFCAPRGSSGQGKGGHEALEEFVEHVKAGNPGGLAVDAPKGPPYIAKHGIVAAAARTGVPIALFGCSAEPAHRFNSWDRTMLPLPFSRVVAVYDREPIIVPQDATRDQQEAIRRQIDERLLRLLYQTDNWFRLSDRYDDPRDIPVPDPVPVPQHPPR